MPATLFITYALAPMPVEVVMNGYMHKLVLGGLVFIFAVGPCAALHWDTEAVYDNNIGQGDCTLVSGAGSIPQVVYGAAGGLRLATRGQDTPWPYVSCVPCGPYGGLSSAAFDGAHHLGIGYVYSDGSTDEVRYATNASGSWVTATLGSLGWLTDFVALAFDSANIPWVAFSDGQFAPSIRVMMRSPTSGWQTQATFADIGDNTGPAIAISADNTVSVGFVDANLGLVKVARRPSSGGWTVETLDGSAANPGQGYTSLAIDPSGRPVIAYFQGPLVGGMSLKYGVRTQSGWQTEQVLQMPASGGCQCSVAVAPDGTPWIAYTDSNDSSLACARKAGGTWVHETVDNLVTADRLSLKVDSHGGAYIAYCDQEWGNVKFAGGTPVRSLADIKSLPDGVPVRCEGLVSTTRDSTNGQDFTDRHYVQASNRSMGILVYYGNTPDLLERDTYVTVTGMTGHVNGEMAIVSPTISPGQSADTSKPLGMTNKALGGGPFAYSPGPPIVGQQGMDGAFGLNNIGLLVRVWGSVVVLDPGTPKKWFKIDDGSGYRVKCLLPAGGNPPSGVVALTGISSCEDIGSGIVNWIQDGPVLRLRASD